MTEIKPIQKEHIKDLYDLIHEFSVFQKSEHLFTNTPERMLAENEFLKGFIVEDKGLIIGYVTYFFCYHTWSGKALHMDDLFIKPNHRGKGFGGQLIEKVISFAKENGCHSLRWQVSQWNKNAQEFYRSLGAKIDDEEINCKLNFE
jgi:diamine N-acetyltransferase